MELNIIIGLHVITILAYITVINFLMLLKSCLVFGDTLSIFNRNYLASQQEFNISRDPSGRYIKLLIVLGH